MFDETLVTLILDRSATTTHGSLCGFVSRAPCGAGSRCAPITGSDAEATHPMHVQAVLGAIERQRAEFAFEVGLHLEQLQAKHLRVRDEPIGATVPDLDRLVDESVGPGCLFGNGVDGMLGDVALSASHRVTVARRDEW